MKTFMAFVLAASLVACAPGTSNYDGTTTPSPTVERIGNVALVYATSKVLNASPERAATANSIATFARDMVESGEINSLDILRTYVENRIDFSSMAPEDEYAVREVIQIISDELAIRGEMAPGGHLLIDGRMKKHIVDVLNAIILVTSR